MGCYDSYICKKTWIRVTFPGVSVLSFLKPTDSWDIFFAGSGRINARIEPVRYSSNADSEKRGLHMEALSCFTFF